MIVDASYVLDLIDATAKARGEPVLTRNVGDFERIDGVSIETY